MEDALLCRFMPEKYLELGFCVKFLLIVKSIPKL